MLIPYYIWNHLGNRGMKMEKELMEILGKNTIDEVGRIVKFAGLYISYWVTALVLAVAVQSQGTDHFMWGIGYVVIAVILAIVMIAMYVRTRPASFAKFTDRMHWNLRKFWVLMAFAILFIAIQVGWSYLVQHDLLPVAENQAGLLSMWKRSKWLMNLDVWIIAPVIEECLFRGLYTNYFLGMQNKAVKGLLMVFSSLIFGLMHTYTFDLSLVMYSTLGMVLMGAHTYFKDIRIPLAFHVINNIL